MGRLQAFIGFACAALLLLFLFGSVTTANLKHKRETGKKCTFCHSGIPNKGDEDPQLNAEGKAFKKNNYQLTEEQKKKPDA